jgi:hypothetical protein
VHFILLDWSNDNLMFNDLVVPRPNACQQLILDLHNEIGHFNEGKMLLKVNRYYFWHNRTKEMKAMVCSYK